MTDLPETQTEQALRAAQGNWNRQLPPELVAPVRRTARRVHALSPALASRRAADFIAGAPAHVASRLAEFEALYQGLPTVAQFGDVFPAWCQGVLLEHYRQQWRQQGLLEARR